MKTYVNQEWRIFDPLWIIVIENLFLYAVLLTG